MWRSVQLFYTKCNKVFIFKNNHFLQILLYSNIINKCKKAIGKVKIRRKFPFPKMEYPIKERHRKNVCIASVVNFLSSENCRKISFFKQFSDLFRYFSDLFRHFPTFFYYFRLFCTPNGIFLCGRRTKYS